MLSFETLTGLGVHVTPVKLDKTRHVSPVTFSDSHKACCIRSETRGKSVRIVFYTKPNCQLCDVVKFELLDLQAEYDFALDEKNILADEALQQEFRLIIPVVDIEETGETGVRSVVRLQAPISQLALRRAVRAAARKQETRQSGADR